MKEAYLYLEKKLKQEDTVVVAVSGGPDSMALLFLLLQLQKESSFLIVCAHVNHNVRAESKEEEQFVASYCASQSIIFESMTIEEYEDKNFHQDARMKRYQFFESLIQKYQANYLFLAHHGDDLLETILMRIVRGSSFQGYAGFEKCVARNGYQLIRPLIELTKQELLEYVEEQGIPYVVDSSNSKDKYTRNRFRKYIEVPLKQEEPKVHHKFYQFSQTLLECHEYIKRQVKLVFPTVYHQQTLWLSEWEELDLFLQKQVIFAILEDLYQDTLQEVSNVHVCSIYELAKGRKPNARLSLPQPWIVRRAYDRLLFEKNPRKEGDYSILLRDVVNLPNGRTIEFLSCSEEENNFICRLKQEEIELPLRVRNRKKGDRIAIKGLSGTKKVKDFLIDRKIDQEVRDQYPIVVDATDTIVWIPGLTKTKFDKTKEEKYDIILKYY